MFSHRISTRVKSRRKHLLVLVYVASSLIWGPAAEASFQLERADGSRPGNGITISGMVTAPREPLGASVGSFLPKPRYEARSAPVALPVASRSTGSTNRFVDPWGCEAEHAQQWSPTGKYWGKYQFDRPTYAAHGGTNYGSASEAEQDRVAARVSYDAWPNC